MVRAVHDVRFRDRWERQRGDAAICGADRLVFDYWRHVCYIVAILKEIPAGNGNIVKVGPGVTDFIVGRISLSDNLPCVGGVDCRCRR